MKIAAEETRLEATTVPAVPEIAIPPVPETANQDGAVKGMVLMAIAMLFLPSMDAIAKLLSTEYGVTAGQTTFGRFVVQATLLAPIIIVWLGWRGLKPKHLLINLLRGALIGGAVLLFFSTLRYMPIADAIAVFFLEPFILTILSAVFLGEKVGWRRVLAVIAGFVGALFVVQPSYEVFGAVALMPVGTAFLFASYLAITRKFSTDDHPLTMQFVSGIGGAITLFAIMGFANWYGIENFSSPDIPEFGIRWGMIFAIGALATVGHLMVVMAFQLANASTLAPFQYLEIVGATLLGYWIFGDFPDALKWLGIAIIVGSGLYLFFREGRVTASKHAE